MSTIKSSNEHLTLNADGSGKDIKFQSNGSEVASIDQAGLVTASALAVDNITIDGTEIDLSSGDLTIDVAGDIILDADGGDINFKDNGTSIFHISNDNSGDVHLESQVSNKDIYIRGNDGGSTINALYFDMSDAGKAIFNSGLAIGGTGAANTLSDYEEGTWSPTITCETSGSYTLQGGADLAAYTKIGRVVTVQGGLSVNGESSPSGNLRITLPFTAFTGTDDTDYCMGNLALGNHGSTLDVAGLNAFIYGGAYFHIWGVNPDGTTRYIKHTDVDTNFQVYFNFSYIAA